MDCGLTGGLLVLEATVSGLLEAADVALNSGSEATIIPSKAQDRATSSGYRDIVAETTAVRSPPALLLGWWYDKSPPDSLYSRDLCS